MQRFAGVAANASGGTFTPDTGATVTVYTAGTTTAVSIYESDETTAKANPFSVNATTGAYEFWAPTGNYDIKVTPSSGSPVTQSNQWMRGDPHVANVREHPYLAKGDGTTDDTAAIQAAIDSGKPVVIPNGTFRVTAQIDVDTADTVIIGRGGIISCDFNGNIFYVQAKRVKFKDVLFKTASASHSSQRQIRTSGKGVADSSNCIIDGCVFICGGGTGIDLESRNRGHSIRNCEFWGAVTSGTFGRFGVNGVSCEHTSIVDCKFREMERGIQFNGGRWCKVAGCDMYNMQTSGIQWIAFRQEQNDFTGTGGNHSSWNTVVGNTIELVGEEGISFDCRGNTSSQWSANGITPVATFSSVGTLSGTSLPINISETGQSDDWANKYWAVVTTGTAAGRAFPITDSASGQITVTIPVNADPSSDFTAGDDIQICFPFLENTVTGNTVTNCNTWGILGWGHFFGGRFSNNTVRDCVCGIGIHGLTDTPSAPTKVQCFSGFSEISHNTVHSSGATGGGTGTSKEYDIDVGVRDFGTSTYSNVVQRVSVRHNVCTSRGIYFGEAVECEAQENEIIAGGLTFDATTECVPGKNMADDGILDPTLSNSPTLTVFLYDRTKSITNSDSPYSANPGERIIADCSSGAITVNCPSAALMKRHERSIRYIKTDASNNLTLDGSGSETINGAATKTVSTQYEAGALFSDGSNLLVEV